MQFYRHTEQLPPDVRGCCLAIGNFDGVHRGHQSVLAKAHRIAQEQDLPFVVMTFEPHPRRYFMPDLPPFRLTTNRTRLHRLQEMSPDAVFMLHFDADLASMTADDFVAQVLCDSLAVKHVVVGDGYVFGKGRSGNVPFLQDKGKEKGFTVTAEPMCLSSDGVPFSSTRIRDFLQTGALEEAERLLGYVWEIEGRVEKGAGKGRQMGAPTLNIPFGDMLIPKEGVYAVEAALETAGEAVWMKGVANIGHRPTVDGKHILTEVHLFDRNENLYNRLVRVRLRAYIRPERHFPSMEALSDQIRRDIQAAKEILETE